MELGCGLVAGPLFVSSFTTIGLTRAGYDWRRHAVSSLAVGRSGWIQRANFMVTGGVSDPGPPVPPTREGMLHNLSAVPVFAGIPVAAMICAVSSARRRQYRWATYSAGSAVVMTRASVRFGAAFGAAPGAGALGGIWQRISITIGLGWLSALSLRTMSQARAVL